MAIGERKQRKMMTSQLDVNRAGHVMLHFYMQPHNIHCIIGDIFYMRFLTYTSLEIFFFYHIF